MSDTKPKWTITTKEKDKQVKGRLEPEKVFTHYLRYGGKKVHSLTGINGLRALEYFAGEWNRANYTPKMVNVKMLSELTQAQRDKLNYLWSPDLFTVESEVKA